MENKPLKLIHIARIQKDRSIRYLFLRFKDAYQYVWFEEENGQEIETGICGSDIEDAIRQANHHWKGSAYRHLRCGFRYTLPERDEHGINALFHQMAASYQSMNGIYYDVDLANNCFVQNASNEARNLLAKLKQENRL